MNDIQKKIQEELKNLQSSKVATQTDAQLARGDFLSNLAKEQVNDPAWKEANKEGAEKRKHDKNWQQNHRQALDKINKDESVSKKRNKRIKEVSSTEEWKANQLKGTHTKRANNENWKKNVRAGAQKREDSNTFNRKELNQEVLATDKWKIAQKQGSANRLKKPENLTTCPYCKKLVDNANYKRWHGDNCKMNKG